MVTHLPRVAAFADNHLVVEKSGDGLVTESGVTRRPRSAPRRPRPAKRRVPVLPADGVGVPLSTFLGTQCATDSLARAPRSRRLVA